MSVVKYVREQERADRTETGKGVLPSRKRRKPTEKAFFFFLLVKKFCGLLSNWRSISQSFRGATAWQKEGSWIMLLHFPLFVCSVR